MRTAATLAATIAAVAAAAVTALPADARPIESAHFINEFVDGPYDCDGLTTAIDEGTVRFHVLGNLRGSSPFPFYVETVNGTVVTTNLDTGGTFTQKVATSGRDHTIVDNGDGTITITQHGQGVVRYYDQFGNFVLKDPGALWTSFDLDYNGTPSDPSDERRRRTPSRSCARPPVAPTSATGTSAKTWSSSPPRRDPVCRQPVIGPSERPLDVAVLRTRRIPSTRRVRADCGCFRMAAARAIGGMGSRDRAIAPPRSQGYVARTWPQETAVRRDVWRRGVGMYGRVVIYTHDEDKDELEAKARAGVIPIVTNTPGYISYGVMFEGNQVVSISQWESEEHAKAADAALAEWVKANTSDEERDALHRRLRMAGTSLPLGRCSVSQDGSSASV